MKEETDTTKVRFIKATQNKNKTNGGKERK